MAFDPTEYLKQKTSSQGFDPTAYLAQKRVPAGTDDSSTLDNILQTGGDAVRGAAQGATLGFADELAGGAEAAGDVLSGKTDLENIIDAYRKHRDESRQLFKEAEERSPTANIIGNIAGGFIPSLLTAGAAAPVAEAGALARIGNAAKVGAGIGAITGLGSSEADITKGDVGQAALDTGKGLVAGGITGGVVGTGIEAAKGIGKGIKAGANWIADTDVGHNFIGSSKYGQLGDSYISRSGTDAVEANSRSITKEIAKQIEKTRAIYGDKIGNAEEALRNVGFKLDGSDDINDIKALITNLRENPDQFAHKDANRLKTLLTNLLDGSEKKATFTGKKFIPGEIIPGTPSAREALELQAAKDKTSANVLGQELKTNIVPSEDDQGNKFLTLLKHSDEQVGASERAVPVVDGEGNVISHDLNEGDSANNFKTKATAKTVLDTPAVPETQTPTKVEQINQELTGRLGGADPSELDYDKASQLKRILNRWNGITGKAPLLNSDDAINETKQIAKSLSEKIAKASPELDASNAGYQNSKEALKTFGLTKRDFVNGELTIDAENKLNSQISRMSKDTHAGDNSANKIKTAFGFLEKADPKLAETLSEKATRASESLDLMQKARGLGLQNKSTYLKSGSAYLGNAIGLGIKNISEASPDQLKQVAQHLVTTGGNGMALASKLADAMKKDSVGRNAALFAIQQNPQYREMLKGYLKQGDK